MTELGKAIKVNRERCGHSLQTLANEARLTKTHVWDLEQGRSRNPTVQTILDLAFALGLSPGALALSAMADLPKTKAKR
jgi:transcriptional regulator with XRE-family HTH domain